MQLLEIIIFAFLPGADTLRAHVINGLLTAIGSVLFVSGSVLFFPVYAEYAHPLVPCEWTYVCVGTRVGVSLCISSAKFCAWRARSNGVMCIMPSYTVKTACRYENAAVWQFVFGSALFLTAAAWDVLEQV